MTDVFIVIHEGDLRDPEVWPYSTPVSALSKAEELISGMEGCVTRCPLSGDMAEDGWIYDVAVGSEYVRVMRREMDKP
jgi:hypothetical protein